MARLVIGVDVVGVDQVQKLSVGISNAEKALQKWLGTSSKASDGNIQEAVHKVDLAFKKLSVTAKTASGSLEAFFKGPKSTATAAILGQAAAIKQMEAAYNGLASAYARADVFASPGTQRIKEASKAIDDNIAAYKKLKTAQAGGGKFDKNTDYIYQLQSYNKAIAIQEKGLKELEMQMRKTAAARNSLSAGSYAVSDYSQQGRDRLAAGSKAGGYDYAEELKKESKLYDDVTGKAKGHTTVMGQLGKAWDDAGKKSSTFHNLMRGASGAMGTLWMTYGQMIPMITGFAAVGGAMKTVNSGANFDFAIRSFQDLAAGAFKTTAALRLMKEEVLAMEGLTAGPGELAAGLLEFARAGISAETAMKGIAEVSRFAYLGEMDMAKATELVVGQLTAFKNVDTGKALNVMAVVADKTSISLAQMAEAFKNTTSLGTVLGLKFDDVAVAIGAMGQAGIRGATAGAALTTMMYKLTAPTASAEKKMRELAVSFSAIDKSTGKLKSIEQIIKDLTVATKGLTEGQKGELFESMVGLRGLKALGALVDVAKEGSEEFEKMKIEVKKMFEAGEGTSYLEQRFNNLTKSGKVQIDILKAELDKLFISSYDNSQTVEALDTLIKTIKDPEVKEGLATIVSGVISIGTALLSFTKTFGGALVTGYLGKIIFGSIAKWSGLAAKATAAVAEVALTTSTAAASAVAASTAATITPAMVAAAKATSAMATFRLAVAEVTASIAASAAAWAPWLVAAAMAAKLAKDIADSTNKGIIDKAAKNGEPLSQAANTFSIVPDMGFAVSQEEQIQLQAKLNDKLKETKGYVTALDILREDLSDKDAEAGTEALNRIDKIKEQVEALNQSPIEIIKEEYAQALRDFNTETATLRGKLKDTAEAQEYFNKKVEEGKKGLDALYDDKLLKSLASEITAAETKWDNYFISIISGFDSVVKKQRELLNNKDFLGQPQQQPVGNFVQDTGKNPWDSTLEKTAAASKKLSDGFVSTLKPSIELTNSALTGLDAGLVKINEQMSNSVTAAADYKKQAEAYTELQKIEEKVIKQRISGTIELAKKNGFESYLTSAEDLAAVIVNLGNVQNDSLDGTAFSVKKVSDANVEAQAKIQALIEFNDDAVSKRNSKDWQAAAQVEAFAKAEAEIAKIRANRKENNSDLEARRVAMEEATLVAKDMYEKQESGFEASERKKIDLQKEYNQAALALKEQELQEAQTLVAKYAEIEVQTGSSDQLDKKKEEARASLAAAEQSFAAAGGKLKIESMKMEEEHTKKVVQHAAEVENAQAELLATYGLTYAATMKQLEADTKMVGIGDTEAKAIKLKTIRLKELIAAKEEEERITQLTNQNKIDELQLEADKAANSNGFGFDAIEKQLAAEKAAIDEKYRIEQQAILDRIELLKSGYNAEIEAATASHEVRMAQIEAENKARYFNDPATLAKANQAALDAEKEASDKISKIKVSNAGKVEKEIAQLIKKYDTSKLKQVQEGLTQERKAFNEKASLFASYADYGSKMLESLADSQDKNSKAGFEAAKKYSQGAVVASTAAAIMNAMTMQPWPLAVAAAAVAAATGAKQLKAVNSATYGGGTIAGISTGSGGGVGASGGMQSTVLGAADGTGSESTSKSFELLKDTYDVTKTKLTGIYESMKDLNKNITGLVTGIVRTGGVSTDGMNLDLEIELGSAASLATTISKIIDPVSEALFGISKLGGWIANGLFGGNVTKEVTKNGLDIGAATVKSILDGASVAVRSFAEVKSVKDGGWFGNDKTSYSTQYAEVDQNVTDLMTMVFKNMGRVLVETAKSLEVDVSKAEAIILEGAALNLKDMDSAEMKVAINEYFSNIADQAAYTLFNSIIGQYQQIDEGLMETATRLIATKESVLYSLEMVGIGFSGTALEAIAFTDSLVNIAGSLEDLTDNINNYYDKFYTDTEKQDRLKSSIQGVFDYLNEGVADSMKLSMPTSREGYRDLVQDIDNITTESGQKLFNTFMMLAETADSYYSLLETQQSDFVAAMKEVDLSWLTEFQETMQDLYEQFIEYRTTLTKGNASVPQMEKLNSWYVNNIMLSLMGDISNAGMTELGVAIETVKDNATEAKLALDKLAPNLPEVARVNTWESESIQKLIDDITNPLAESLSEAGMSDFSKSLADLDVRLGEITTSILEATTAGANVDFDVTAWYNNAVKGLLQADLDKIDGVIANAGLTDFQKSFNAVNKEYTDIIARLTEAGYDLTDATNAWGVAIQELKQPTIDTVDEIIDTEGFTDTQTSLRTLMKTFDDYVDIVQTANGTTEELARIEKGRFIKLGELLKTVSDNYDSALTTLANAEQALADLRLDTEKQLLDDMLTVASDALSTLEDNLTKATDNLNKAFDKAQADLTLQYEAKDKDLNAQLDISNTAMSDMKSLTDSFKSALESMSLNTEQYNINRLAVAKKEVQAAVDAAQAGNFGPAKDIDKSVSVLTSTTPEMFASSEDYQRNFWSSFASISELEKLTGTQLTIEEQTVAALETQIEENKAWYESQQALLTSQLEAILGTNEAVLSLTDATEAYYTALAARDSKAAEVAVAQQAVNTSANDTATADRAAQLKAAEDAVVLAQQNVDLAKEAKGLVQEAYDSASAGVIADAAFYAADAANNVLTQAAFADAADNVIDIEGYNVDLVKLAEDDLSMQNAWKEMTVAYNNMMLQQTMNINSNLMMVASSNYSAASIVSSTVMNAASMISGAIRSGGEPAVGIQGSFAVGTDYVPHDMVAQIHKGERIVPAAYNRNDSTNAALVEEVRMLREEMRSIGYETARNTKKMASVMDVWDGDGMPETRV